MAKMHDVRLAEVKTVLGQIVVLSALSNLGTNENPLDRLTAIFALAVKAEAIIEFEAVYEQARLTDLQKRQLNFLSSHTAPDYPPATPVYHVSCHTCHDNAHFHGSVGAQAYIKDHAGHKTWLSWDDERVDDGAAAERDAAWADEATREQAAQDAIADQAEADFQAWVADGEIAAAESFDVNEQELDRELEIGIFSE